MDLSTKAVLRTIGAPARVTEKRLAGLRQPIWRLCWIVLWTLLLWDVYLALDCVEGNTWSEVAREASRAHPFVPWILGASIGHLFHHRDDLPPIVDSNAAATIMVVLTLGIFILGLTGLELSGWQITATALVGLVVGYRLWPRPRTQEWHW